MSVTEHSIPFGTGRVEALTAVRQGERLGTVVYVHGHGFHAVASIPLAWYLTAAGYHCLLVSQPGYGGSTGPPDYCGPNTVAAVLAAVEALVPAGDLPLFLWGFSRGAAVTGQAIRVRPGQFAAAVLQSGGYDLQRDYEQSRDEGFRANLMRETGGDAEELRVRSLIHHVGAIPCPVLVLQGDSDETYLPANARRFVGELERTGKPHEFHILPGPHELPWELVAEAALPFLDRIRQVSG
jgi:dipeptidyl aminopeptidase/acylaminoacyl peptidase